MSSFISHQSIQLCQLQQGHANEPAAVNFSIIIRADHTWTAFLCGRQVRLSSEELYCSYIVVCYNIKGSLLKPPHGFSWLFAHYLKCHRCFISITPVISMYDSLFEPLIEARKGAFKNTQGIGNNSFLYTKPVYFCYCKGLKLLLKLSPHLLEKPHKVWPHNS